MHESASERTLGYLRRHRSELSQTLHKFYARNRFRSESECEEPIPLTEVCGLTADADVPVTILALIYSSRVTASFSQQQLLFLSIMAASKYLVDQGEEEELADTEWTSLLRTACGGAQLSRHELATLEMDFLDQLDWELYCGAAEFEVWLHEVRLHVLDSLILSRRPLCYDSVCEAISSTRLLAKLPTAKQILLSATIITSAYLATMATALSFALLLTNPALQPLPPQLVSPCIPPCQHELHYPNYLHSALSNSTVVPLNHLVLAPPRLWQASPPAATLQSISVF